MKLLPWKPSHQLRTKLDGPPAIRLRPLTLFLPRCPAIQLSLMFRPTLETFGARAFPAFFPDEFPSSTRIVVLPCLMSFGGFSTLSRNFSLLDFFCTRPSVSGGGVGGLVTGTAFRISSGRRAGRAGRRVSWVVDPWRVAVLSDSISSGLVPLPAF